MNLKEAFRFQNRLQSLIIECMEILGNEKNITRTETTFLRGKVMEGAENETVTELAPSEYADRVNDIVEMTMRLLRERERLFRAVREAKSAMEVDFDAESGMNTQRRTVAAVLRRMADLRSTESVSQNGGFGYRFNTDGVQVSYKCDVKRVTTIHYDRNLVRRYMAELDRKADGISARLDQALVNAEVDYAPPFDVNASFADVLECLTANA